MEIHRNRGEPFYNVYLKPHRERDETLNTDLSTIVGGVQKSDHGGLEQSGVAPRRQWGSVWLSRMGELEWCEEEGMHPQLDLPSSFSLPLELCILTHAHVSEHSL